MFGNRPEARRGRRAAGALLALLCVLVLIAAAPAAAIDHHPPTPPAATVHHHPPTRSTVAFTGEATATAPRLAAVSGYARGHVPASALTTRAVVAVASFAALVAAVLVALAAIAGRRTGGRTLRQIRETPTLHTSVERDRLAA